MSDRLPDGVPPELDPGPIYNPDSPFWHKVDFDALDHDDPDALTNQAAYLCSTLALFLAKLGYATRWFPPDPTLVCPLPPWMIADAYARIDELKRPAKYWAAVMSEQGYKAYAPDVSADSGLDDDDDAEATAALKAAHADFEAFLRKNET